MRTRAVLLAVLVLLIGGCSQNWINEQVQPIRDMTLAGSAFTQALHQGYLERSDAEYSGRDLSDTLGYAELARRAGRGEEVAPVDPGAWGLGPADLAQADAAYRRLTAAFDAGAKRLVPAATARAQVAYDCMVREACPQEKHQYNVGCAAAFAAAMGEVERALAPAAPAAAAAKTKAAAPVARDFLVFFDFDKTNVRPDAGVVLDRVVAAIAELRSQRITLTGHADRAGPAAYNQRLSERRAKSVRDYLVRKGVVPSGITMAGRGETDPRVPTPDGMREKENRRVEIRIE